MKTFTKKTILIFATLLLSLINQAQTVEWVNNYQANAGVSVATDVTGNVYSIGYFQSTGVFGSYTLTSTGFNSIDIFITKTDALGNVLWAKKIGSKSSDFPNAVSVSSSGVYVAGSFGDTLIVGTNTLINNTAPYTTPFLCKLDLLGNFVWAKQYKVTSISSICNDGAGNLFATGSFTGTSVFGTFTTTSTGSDDAFISQIDASGTTISFNKYGGSSSDAGRAIKSDAAGNIYLGGFFNGTAFIGSVALTSLGNSDAFVAKLNSAGSVTWAKQFGGNNADGVASISINSANNIYIGGVYTSPATVGSNTFTTGNSFVCQLDNAGSVLWANEFGGSGSSNYANISSITSDASGNVYSTGSFQGSASFGSSTLSAAFLSSSFSDNVFISKLDPSGAFGWVKGFGTGANDNGNSICENGGKLYTTGYLGGSTVTTVDNFTVSSGAYLIKVSSTPLGIKENYNNLSVKIYPNPVKDKLVIESEELNQNLQVSVTDVLGKEVLTKSFSNSKTETLDLSMLLPGVYFVRISAGKNSGVVRIVKE